MTRKAPRPSPKSGNRLVLLGLGALAVGIFGVAGWMAISPPSKSGQQGVVDSGPQETGPPNVVIFLIDTLRADRLGCYGYDQPTSPRLDALATESVLFEQCSAAAPWTLPSVVSLLTSTFACEHRVLVDGQQIGRSLVPLAERFKTAGYATAAFYANAYAGSMTGLDRGYDVSQSVQYVDGKLLDRYFDTYRAEPFHLYLHNIEPHNPYSVPQQLVEPFGQVSPRTRQSIKDRYLDYRKLTRADFAAGRSIGTTDNTAEQTEALRALDALKDEIDILYNAAVRQADHRLGQVIDVLKRRGRWDNTLFIVTADHGEELGDHGGWQHDQSVCQEMIHVPVVMHLPQGRLGGRRVGEPVSLVDLMPTILDLAGRPDLATGCRGVSLVPLFEEDSPAQERSYRLTAMRMNRKKYYQPYKQTRGDDNLVVRLGDYKGIWNVEVGTVELYDLGADPGERIDLAAQYSDLADSMRRFAESWMAECGQDVPEPPAARLEDMDEQVLENLRSLGYIE